MAAVRFDGGLPVEWDGQSAEFMAFTSSLDISLSCMLVFFVSSANTDTFL